MPDKESPSPPECFICTESAPRPHRSACLCTDRHMHTECFVKMLKAQKGEPKCGVCGALYEDVGWKTKRVPQFISPRGPHGAPTALPDRQPDARQRRGHAQNHDGGQHDDFCRHAFNARGLIAERAARCGRRRSRERPRGRDAGRQGGGRRALLGPGRAGAAGQCAGQQAWSATRRQQGPRYPAAGREPAMAGLDEPRRVPRRLGCAAQRPVAERVLRLDGGGLHCWRGLAGRQACGRPLRSSATSDGSAGEGAGSRPERATSTAGDRRGQGPHELPRADDPPP